MLPSRLIACPEARTFPGISCRSVFGFQGLFTQKSSHDDSDIAGTKVLADPDPSCMNFRSRLAGPT